MTLAVIPVVDRAGSTARSDYVPYFFFAAFFFVFFFAAFFFAIPLTPFALASRARELIGRPQVPDLFPSRVASESLLHLIPKRRGTLPFFLPTPANNATAFF